VTYEVIFTSVAAEAVTLESITDTLPADFVYGGMALGSDVGEPTDDVEPEIVWESVVVPANGTLTLRYNVRALDSGGQYSNSVVAVSGGEQIGPASATLEVEGYWAFLPTVFRNYEPPLPVWQLHKTADPTEIEPGGRVTYTVKIENIGTAAGELETITDALPEGLTFIAMLPGSDVTTLPSGTTGTISWDGLWSLSPGESLDLLYEVEADGGGEKTNTVTAYDGNGTPVGTASSTITLAGGLPFEEDFTNGVSEDWEPFLNWTGLSADRWYWAGELGSWGIYNYDSELVLPENTSYDLSIYNGPGAQSWTDYRIEARIKDVKDHNLQQGLTGLWFRGTYADSGAMDGRAVGGYYLYMRPDNDYLYLGRIASSTVFYDWDIVDSYYYAPRIGRKHWYDVIIEVEGPHIQVWFGDDQDGLVKAFDWTDPQNVWPNGTVGFAVYYTASRFDYIHVLSLE
jgi:uncharacterized repeat protein (TIGR01451 family)